jgi:hypothetical protein
MCHASVTSSRSRVISMASAPNHHWRRSVLGGCSEEHLRLAQQQRLLLRLIAHIQDGDVGADDPPLTRNVLGV